MTDAATRRSFGQKQRSTVRRERNARVGHDGGRHLSQRTKNQASKDGRVLTCVGIALLMSHLCRPQLLSVQKNHSEALRTHDMFTAQSVCWINQHLYARRHYTRVFYPYCLPPTVSFNHVYQDPYSHRFLLPSRDYAVAFPSILQLKTCNICLYNLSLCDLCIEANVNALQ